MQVAAKPFGTEWWKEAPEVPGLLALGSGILLAAALWTVSATSSPTPVSFIFYLWLLSGVAVAVHFVAWTRLARISRASPSMTWLFRASIAGFVFGPLVWGATISPDPRTYYYAGWYFIIVSAPLLPYFPFVFGPVVIAHALSFLSTVRVMHDPTSIGVVLAGGTFLIADALLSFTSDPLSYSPPWFMLYSGATVFGYLIVFVGWSRESSVAGVLRGPAAEDRGAPF